MIIASRHSFQLWIHPEHASFCVKMSFQFPPERAVASFLKRAACTYINYLPAWTSWRDQTLRHLQACCQLQQSWQVTWSYPVYRRQTVESSAQYIPPSWTHFRSMPYCEQCYPLVPVHSTLPSDSWGTIKHETTSQGKSNHKQKWKNAHPISTTEYTIDVC